MQIEILTPEKKIYDGDVFGIQLPGVSGSFEVLDRHAPLVSALSTGVLKNLVGQQKARQTPTASLADSLKC